jgi:hypothetical protein
MTDACTFPIVAANGIARSRAIVASAGKPRCDKGLQENVTAQAARNEAQDARSGRGQESRSGTYSNAPLWNGPRLQAAFVAQVLGQVLAPQTGDLRLAIAAYQRDHVRGLQSRLLDSAI